MGQKSIITVSFVILIWLNTYSQNNLIGRIYLRDGSPFGWIRLTTDSSGFYYSKGDVGNLPLDTSELEWHSINDTTIIMRFDFWEPEETMTLFYNKAEDILRSNDSLEVFIRSKKITFEGKTYKE